MRKKSTDSSNTVHGRGLTSSEGKAMIDSTTKINSNNKDVAIHVSDKFDGIAQRRHETLLEELQNINREMEKAENQEERDKFQKEKDEILEQDALVFESARSDQKEVLAFQEKATDKAMWEKLAIMGGIAAGTGVILNYSKPVISSIGRAVPKLISKH